MVDDLKHELSPALSVSGGSVAARVPVLSGSLDINVADPSLRDLIRTTSDAVEGLLVTVARSTMPQDEGYPADRLGGSAPDS